MLDEESSREQIESSLLSRAQRSQDTTEIVVTTGTFNRQVRCPLLRRYIHMDSLELSSYKVGSLAIFNLFFAQEALRTDTFWRPRERKKICRIAACTLSRRTRKEKSPDLGSSCGPVERFNKQMKARVLKKKIGRYE